MARTRTDAAERTEQNRRLVEQVSAELGRPVSRREAEQHRRESKHLVPDREFDVDPERLQRIGQVLGKPRQYKELSGYAEITVQTSTEYGHLLLDASRLGEGKKLLITFDVVGA